MAESIVDLSIGRVNEQVVRIVAGCVAVLILVSIINDWFWIPLYLTFDFFLRAQTSFKPPLAVFAKLIAEKFSLKPKWIFAPPKKFAAFVGFIFSLTITLLFLLELPYAAKAVSMVLLSCAILEAGFGICLGCYFFDWFVAPIQNKLKR